MIKKERIRREKLEDFYETHAFFFYSEPTISCSLPFGMKKQEKSRSKPFTCFGQKYLLDSVHFSFMVLSSSLFYLSLPSSHSLYVSSKSFFIFIFNFNMCFGFFRSILFCFKHSLISLSIGVNLYKLFFLSSRIFFLN